jgi:hypothetical protein
MPEIDELVPFRQAARMAGMRTTKAYSEVAAGRLKICRNGRRSFIRASEVQRYIDSLSDTSRQAA